MSVITSNLLAGAGELYRGDFGTAEPADTAVAIAAAPGAGWTNFGGLDGGVNLIIAQEFLRLRADQIQMSPASQRTSFEATIATALAEITLENYLHALNIDPTTITAGTGAKHINIGGGDANEETEYSALVFDGKAPAGYRRRIIARKVLSVEAVGKAYQRAEQTFIPVTFRLHYVSSSIKPIHIAETTA